MKELEFMELLGELPAEYIEAASKPQKKERRFAWLRYGVPALAACFAVVIFAAVYPRLKSPDIPSVDSQPDITVITTADTANAGTGLTDGAVTILSEQTGLSGHRTTQTLTVSSGRDKTDPDHTTQEQHKDQTDPSAEGTAHSSESTARTDETDKTDPHSVTTGRTTHSSAKTSNATTAKTTTTKPQTSTTPTSSTANPRTTTKTGTTTRAVTTTRTGTTTRARYSTTFTTTTAALTTTGGTTGTTAAYSSTEPPMASSNTYIEQTEISATSDGGSSAHSTTAPVPAQDEREVLKWQIYDTEPLYSDLDISYEILDSMPWNTDNYQQLRDFDFDRYNCLVMHLRTNATDAVLTTVNLSLDYSTINSMIFRQPTDPTTRHFVFAVAVPKDFGLRYDPDFVFEATDDASFYYSAVPSESDVYYEGEW